MKAHVHNYFFASKVHATLCYRVCFELFFFMMNWLIGSLFCSCTSHYVTVETFVPC